jgi:RecQ family ATP-dependent DNA helicase
MQRSIAVIFRNLESFRTIGTQRLPAGPKQRLAADLSRFLTRPGINDWHFQAPLGTGLNKSLSELFQLYAAIRFFFTGEKTRLHLNSSPAGYQPPWLEIIPLNSEADYVPINPDGSLACFLPPLPRSLRCSSYQQPKYHLTPELAAWITQRIWNFSSLRQGQYEVIERLSHGKNTLAILPTGAGKSLCFQLPALLLPGVTLVVSPLKSLMRDQYLNLTKSGINGAEFIDSSQTVEEKNAVLDKMKSGEVKLLYLSPERLQIESFQRELADTAYPISLFVIDEAHCISEWGHDFRPSYLRLRHFVSQLNNPPICALTATASRYVRQDILALLGLNTQDMITPSTLDRKEISLQVRLLTQEADIHKELVNIVRTEIPAVLGRSLEDIHQQGAGVIFTPYAAPRGISNRPLGSETISRLLQNNGLDCRHYHSQLSDSRRISTQDQFKENAFPLLVATKGYGMGIDKENIDYIVHLSAPASLEAYYQEAGRAGRDGEHAHSVIIARPRLEKCIQQCKTGLPGCHRGWKCQYTGGEKCSYGIQAGLLAQEYPPEQESLQRFCRFLDVLAAYAQAGEKFRYVCPCRESARQQKYLYYLEQLGALREYRILEYRKAADNQFDLLVQVELAAADSLDNRYWLANKVIERIETHKAQKLNMLDTVQLYIKTDTCRRRLLMQYFGDDSRYERCNFCDCDGISPAAAPEAVKAASSNRLLLEESLVQQDLSLALELVAVEDRETSDEITVRAMRELEDRPYNPAALFLAGIFSCLRPETEIYGLRNLQGAVDAALADCPQLVPEIFKHIAMPEMAYTLAGKYLDRLECTALKQLAARLDPPDQYPDVHLALLLPQLQQINHALMEVPTYDS